MLHSCTCCCPAGLASGNLFQSGTQCASSGLRSERESAAAPAARSSRKCVAGACGPSWCAQSPRPPVAKEILVQVCQHGIYKRWSGETVEHRQFDEIHNQKTQKPEYKYTVCIRTWYSLSRNTSSFVRSTSSAVSFSWILLILMRNYLYLQIDKKRRCKFKLHRAK